MSTEQLEFFPGLEDEVYDVQRSQRPFPYKRPVEMISPSLAEHYLTKLHPDQRDLNLNWVRQFAQQMRDGKWTVSEPLIFDEDDYLIEGQHRLHAVIHSGTSQPFYVERGYSKEAFKHMNQGRTRTLVDLLRTNGSKCSRNVANVSKFLIRERGRWTLSESEALAKTIEHYREPLAIADRTSHQKFIGTVPYRALMVAAYYSGMSEETLTHFTKVVHEGVGVPEEKVPVLLRKHLLKTHGMSMVNFNQFMASHLSACLVLWNKGATDVKSYTPHSDYRNRWRIFNDFRETFNHYKQA